MGGGYGDLLEALWCLTVLVELLMSEVGLYGVECCRICLGNGWHCHAFFSGEFLVQFEF